MANTTRSTTFLVLLSVFLALFSFVAAEAAPSSSTTGMTSVDNLSARSGCWSCCKRAFCQCVAHPPAGEVGNYNQCANVAAHACTAWQLVKLDFVI
ncbi:hypothetical protein HKX48_002843, partial [Thoreauomyces humboldtii]